tara:strand:+ start:344 stop:1084 length:741 start_codon:yes stop_codon:yes gene_type:complete
MLKLIKKTIEAFGYKILDKKLYKNQRLVSQNSILTISHFLKKYFDEKKINSLVQIGANDGLRFDDLNFFIKKYKIKSVLVEPLEYYFSILKKNYQNYENIFFENSAITIDEKDKFLFTVNQKYIHLYDDHIPGINSFEKKHLINHGVKKKHITKKKINSLKIDELINKYKLFELDLLFIDAEGYDVNIVYDFLLNLDLKPIIIFEYIHADTKKLGNVIELLKKKKYIHFTINENILCIPIEKNFFL